jgi:hypothetical protein
VNIFVIRRYNPAAQADDFSDEAALLQFIQLVFADKTEIRPIVTDVRDRILPGSNKYQFCTISHVGPGNAVHVTACHLTRKKDGFWSVPRWGQEASEVDGTASNRFEMLRHLFDETAYGPRLHVAEPNKALVAAFLHHLCAKAVLGG